MPDLQNRGSGGDAHRFAPAAPDEEYVYGACCPDWHTAASHEVARDDWIEFMRRTGIERVCCLVPEPRIDDSECDIERFRREFGPDRVRHAPIPDRQLVDEAVLSEDVLPFISDAVATEEPVVVYCLAGIGRTGQVLSAWLVYDRDYPPERAVETVESMGRLPDNPVRRGNATAADLHERLAAVD